MRRVLPIVLLAACWPIPKGDPCLEPELWYPPDGSGDVVWGCEAPAPGWTNEPEDTAVETTDTDTDPTTPTGDTGGDTDTDTDTDPPLPTADTGVQETGLVASGQTADTFETADTFPTADTGLLPETAETADTGGP